MGFMTFVYDESEWFWKSIPVLIAFVVCDGALFLWFIKDLELRFHGKVLNAALALAFAGGYFFLQYQYYQVVKHCLFFLGGLIAYTLLSRKTPWKTSVFLCSGFILLLELARLLTKDGTFAPMLQSTFPGLPALWVNIFLLAAYALVAFLLVWRLGIYFRKYLTITMTLWHLLLLLLPLGIYLLVRSTEFYAMTAEWGDNTILENLQYAEIGVAGCAVAVTSILGSMITAQREITEHLRMEMLLQSQQQQYLIKTESIEAVNRKYHDLKHLVSGIRAMDQEEARSFADTLEKEIQPFECIQETGNDMLNILLTERIRQCQSLQIRIVPYIDAKELTFVNNLDLCALFGNAMDNAIEACSKVDEKHREIYIKIHRSGDMVLFCIQNTYDGPLKQENGRLLSSKADAAEHGFGTENIRRIAEKYNGSAAWEAEEHVFTMNILLPIPKETGTDLSAGVN